MTTTLDIRHYLLSHSSWVDPDNTVDTVKIGDPNREVRKAGVCWMPSIENIRAAHHAGCDLLVVHEPTFWEHAASELAWRDQEPGVAKREFLEKTGMVILRAHDSWDNWPDIGIRDSWARGLGLTRLVREGSVLRWHAMYEVPAQTLRDFSRYIAQRIKPLGEDSVQVIGDPDKTIRYPSLGVGCVGPDREMVEFGSDVLIVCFDGASYWSTRERLAEMGVGVIAVEHGTSEMWGIENLCAHLSQVFPEVAFQYFASHPRTWIASA
ncbi:MAG: Nif3-like dinuclear metal center hexameric protein [Candidatus Hydrogenedentes bacterium]|nr:Nif3-like dinuclear metal center hexameric protein [Candidatus Hydrogenedentota bacterium]